MVFDTRYDPVASGYVPPVRSFPFTAPKYAYDIDKSTGRKVVKKVGETNFYQQIQEAVPDTLIYNIIDRINKTGDYSLLGENLGGFIDATNMPRNLLEAETIRVKTEMLFNALPMEERAKYDHDINRFVASVNDKLLEKVKKSRETVKAGNPAPTPAPDEPSKEVPKQ